MYRKLRAGEPWDGSPVELEPDGNPRTHDILRQLGTIPQSHHTPITSEELRQESVAGKATTRTSPPVQPNRTNPAPPLLPETTTNAGPNWQGQLPRALRLEEPLTSTSDLPGGAINASPWGIFPTRGGNDANSGYDYRLLELLNGAYVD
jgi:hypothetical protein